MARWAAARARLDIRRHIALTHSILRRGFRHRAFHSGQTKPRLRRRAGRAQRVPPPPCPHGHSSRRQRAVSHAVRNVASSGANQRRAVRRIGHRVASLVPFERKTRREEVGVTTRSAHPPGRLGVDGESRRPDQRIISLGKGSTASTNGSFASRCWHSDAKASISRRAIRRMMLSNSANDASRSAGSRRGLPA